MLLSDAASCAGEVSQSLKKLLGLSSKSDCFAMLSRQASHSPSLAKGLSKPSKEAVKQSSSQKDCC